MNEALKYVPHDSFTKPDTIPYAALQPILNGDWSNGGKGAHTILSHIHKDDPRGASPANPAFDQQYSHWEYGIQAWSGRAGLTQDGAEPGSEAAVAGALIPAPDVVLPTQQTHTFAITNPARSARIEAGRPITITVSHTGPQPLEKVEYHVNGVFMGASNNEPFSLTVVPETRAETTIRAVGHIKFSGGVFTDTVTLPTN
jgi:hypothetical protein